VTKTLTVPQKVSDIINAGGHQAEKLIEEIKAISKRFGNRYLNIIPSEDVFLGISGAGISLRGESSRVEEHLIILTTHLKQLVIGCVILG
jgi:hypothetical protein